MKGATRQASSPVKLPFAPAVPADVLDAIAAIDRVSRVRVMAVASDATAISTREKSMRTSVEGTFSGVVVIDASYFS
ncbi:MAG TPA: hypothetical protein VJU59_11395 [Paraburkholderia sp.]|uniref:hypothetical protein n=1 Tax=Paraburkholderia sp. TaxID=1926495 RepID=UPI002B48162C|nr:hypothetical protein [Paraburkholderia sp.]HKR40263.1 hypothetical protein [Paraburkholderia sp.]